MSHVRTAPEKLAQLTHCVADDGIAANVDHLLLMRAPTTPAPASRRGRRRPPHLISPSSGDVDENWGRPVGHPVRRR